MKKQDIVISVIIPTHNRCKLLPSVIHSIQNQSINHDMYEIVVVDNGSTDHTKRVVYELADSSAVAIHYVHECKVGLHYARHLGALHAQSDILLYCDDDIIAGHEWVEQIFSCYRGNYTVGAVGGKIIGFWSNAAPKWINEFGTDQKMGPLSLLNIGEDVITLSNSQYIYGCNFSILKSVLFESGGFNPDGFPDDMLIYRGDGEIGLQKKIRNIGYKILYNGKAVVHHVINVERLTPEYIKQRFFREGYSRAYGRFRDNRGSLCRFILGTLISGLRILYYKNCRYLVSNYSKRLKLDSYGILMSSDFNQARRIIRDVRLQKYIMRKSYLVD